MPFVGAVYNLLPAEDLAAQEYQKTNLLCILTDDLQPMASGFRKYVDEHQFSYLVGQTISYKLQCQ